MLLWNMVFYIKERTQAKPICKKIMRWIFYLERDENE